MGTVITASETGKPLVMMPRRPELKEVTSNHQIATAKWLSGRPGLFLVWSEEELDASISKASSSDGVDSIDTGKRDSLVTALRQFIVS
jgi:UDP-N-acetylglucosamine transferase subunit ALG13